MEPADPAFARIVSRCIKLVEYAVLHCQPIPGQRPDVADRLCQMPAVRKDKHVRQIRFGRRRNRSCGIDIKSEAGRRERRTKVADEVVVPPAREHRLPNPVKIAAEDQAGVVFRLVHQPEVDQHPVPEIEALQVLIDRLQAVEAFGRAAVTEQAVRFFEHLFPSEQARQIFERRCGRIFPERFEQVSRAA